jgi:hypothetical protein
MTYATRTATQAAATLHPGIPSLEELQKLVEGYVQAIMLPDLPGVLWCNEDGKVHRLGMNAWASELAGPQINPWDWICGTVVITGPADRRGNTTTLSTQALEQLAPTEPDVADASPAGVAYLEGL